MTLGEKFIHSTWILSPPKSSKTRLGIQLRHRQKVGFLLYVGQKLARWCLYLDRLANRI